MGEIKSTLDLVMEKTKHLSLSEDEKAGQQRDVYEKRIKGILQKYADGLFTLEDSQNQLTSIQENLGLNNNQPLVRQILDRVSPDQDSTLWLDLLDTYMPHLRTPIQNLLSTYAQRRKSLLQTGSQSYLEQLKSNHAIHGSAVLPNLIGDKTLQDKLTILRQEALSKIANLMPVISRLANLNEGG